MKLSDAIAYYLYNRGVRVVFGYQGGSITHMIDSFSKCGIKYVQSYNEQGAGLAADAYARTSKIGFGIAIATNGPGATNLLTAIANAYCDSVPVIFFTGQVHSYSIKKNAAIRQESFQEIDIVSMVKVITKYSVTIKDKNSALDEIDRAIDMALKGRKGPVLIDLPVDIQGENVDMSFSVMEQQIACWDEEIYESYATKISEYIKKALRPVILAGGGVRQSNAIEQFRKFVNMTGIPVVCSLMALDVLEHENRNFLGFIGSYGNRYANIALQNSDLIIVMGSRLDMRQTGKKRELFAPNARIIHLDIDQSELGHFFEDEIKIYCDINILLKKLICTVQREKYPDITEWKMYIKKIREQYPSHCEFCTHEEYNPNLFMKTIGEQISDKSIITLDVGQNQMWAAQSLRIKGEKNRIICSGGLGTMGYSLPAGIGAFFAHKDHHIICIMGDGGLQMNIQELQVIAHYGLSIKIIIMRNDALGLIRDIQEKYYDRRYIGSIDGFSVPPLDRIADAYDMKYKRIDKIEDFTGLKEMLSDTQAYLIEIVVPQCSYVRPELLGMDELDRQSPYKLEIN